MIEDTDGQTAGTEGETEELVAPSQVEAATEQTSEDTAEQQTGADDTGQADETGAAPKKKPWWEKRFDELTAKRYEAENQAAYWRGLAEAGGRPAQAETQQEGPPTEDQFETWDDYQEALIEYKVDQRIKAEETKRQRGAVLQTYEQRAAKFTESHPDYQSVALGDHVKITPLMAEVIRESDLGPEVAYHLGSNPTEAQHIANLPPHRQAAELGKLEAKLTAQPAAAPPSPKPIPPEPPKTVSGLTAGINKKPEEMSMAEYMEWHRTRDQ